MSDIYLSLTETPTVVTLSQPVVSGVLSSNVTVTNVVSVNVVTMPAITVQASAPAVTTVAGTVAANVSALNIDTSFSGSALFGVSGQDVNAVRTVIYSSANSDFGSDQGAPVDSSNPLPVTGTVAVNGSVTAYSNLHAYAEGVFQRVGGYPIGSGGTARLSLEVNGPDGLGLPSVSGIPAVPIAGTVTVGNSVTIGSLPAISGTVTANDPSLIARSGGSVSDSVQNIQVVGGRSGGGGGNSSYAPIYVDPDGSVIVRQRWVNAAGSANLSINENTPLPVQLYTGAVPTSVTIGATIANSVTIGSLPTLAPQFPRVTLIDGSGTVATANTAITVFASSSTRSYLLVQVTTGSAFVNVGATATTVNGINLTAGQGYSWETTIPQGVVSLISTTTSSRYVAKEA